MITATPIITDNNRREEKERNDTAFMQSFILTDDSSFVAKSNMTTDEAIYIKNGMLRYIRKEFGSSFTTESVTIIEDARIVNARRERQTEMMIDALIVFIAVILTVAFIKYIVLKQGVN